jgi:hypothetical protein
MSPWVATTRFSLVATITLQPVPQKRHGALSHLSSDSSRSVTRFAAIAGAGMPPARAAIAAAFILRTSRRSGCDVVMMISLPRDDSSFGSIDDDHELAFGIAGVDLAAGDRQDGFLDIRQAFRPRLHQDTRDLAARRREDGIRIHNPSGNECAAIDGSVFSGHVMASLGCSHFVGGPGGPAIIW